MQQAANLILQILIFKNRAFFQSYIRQISHKGRKETTFGTSVALTSKEKIRSSDYTKTKFADNDIFIFNGSGGKCHVKSVFL